MSAAHALVFVGVLLAIPIAVCSCTHGRFFLRVLCPVVTMTLMLTLLVTLTWSFVHDRVIGEAEFIVRSGRAMSEDRLASRDTLSDGLADSEIAALTYVQVVSRRRRRR